MNLKEYEELMVNTSERDWTKISCWGAGSGPSYLNRFDVWQSGSGDFKNIEIDSHAEYMSLRKDLLVSVAWGLSHNDEFKEDWANNFPDPHATSSFIDFFYSGVLVYRDIYVSVDGGRCYIPLPKIIRNKETFKIEKIFITKNRYEFFKIINGNDSEYDSYLRDAHIEVVDGEWMNGDGY